MTRSSRVWLVLAVLFTLVNLAGAVFAGVRGELPHAATHIALTVLGAWLVSWIAPQRGAGATISTVPPEFTDRLTRLEQSVDAVAIEVERIGEGQRFMTRLFSESGVATSGAPVAPDADGHPAPRGRG